MGFARQLNRQKKSATKNELQEAYNKGFTAGVKQGFTNAEIYINEKMEKLHEVKGIGTVLGTRILLHLGYTFVKEKDE